MSLPVKIIVRFLLFVLFQVLVLDRVLLFNVVTPSIYFLFLLWLPFRTPRPMLMIAGFILGLTVDYFHHTPGFCAAACVLVAYLRPYMVNILIPQEGAENMYEAPSIKSMGGVMPYMVFAGILCIVHNFWLFLLQAATFGNFFYLLMKTVLSTIVSLVLILIVELLFVRKQKYRTNARR